MTDDPAPDSAEDPAPRARPGLARGPGAGAQIDLEAVVADRLMARSDAGAAIALDLEMSAGVDLPRVADIAGVEGTEGALAHESLRQIEALLSLDRIGELAEEGSRLNQLLDRDGATLGERKILRRGMLFLRRGMYREAEEWWTLNQPPDANAPFHLLIQLLQVLTCKLAGNESRAATLLAQLKPKLHEPGRR